MYQFIKAITVTLTISLFLVSCSAHQVSNKQSLYEQLGGQEGLNAIVNNFINQIGKDKDILPYFSDSSISRFRENITLHFCMLADGPCKYEGDTMIDIHTGMNITESDFNRVVDLLINAMEEQHIPHRIQNQLLARLVPLRSSITYR